MEEIIANYGETRVLNELMQWLPAEAIDEFVEDFKRLYNDDDYE